MTIEQVKQQAYHIEDFYLIIGQSDEWMEVKDFARAEELDLVENGGLITSDDIPTNTKYIEYDNAYYKATYEFSIDTLEKVFKLEYIDYVI